LGPVGHQPRPAAAELTLSRLDKFFPERVERSERLVDPFGELAARLAAAGRLQAVPEERMVPGLCGVVEDVDRLLVGGIRRRAHDLG
jgi:hypothetical protein